MDIFRALADDIRRLRGWQEHLVLVMVRDDTGVFAVDRLSALARNQGHAHRRVYRHVQRTLPNGWVAYVSGEKVTS